MHTRHDLTDDQWRVLEPLLPDRAPVRGGRWMDHRLVVNGIMWRTRTGSPWRDLPECYGNWKTVYNRHRRWSGDGTWRSVLDELRVGCDSVDGEQWNVSADGTVIRAHHHSAGARRLPPGDIAAEVLAPTILDEGLRPAKLTGGSFELQENGPARAGSGPGGFGA